MTVVKRGRVGGLRGPGLTSADTVTLNAAVVAGQSARDLAREWASKETGEPDTANFPGKLSAYQEAQRAVAEADRAGAAAAIAESLVGPSYPNIAAGLAATTNGETFAVNNGDGTVTIYLNDGGSESEQRTLATTGALALPSAGRLIGGYKVIAELFASTEASRGVGAIWEVGNYSYIEADPGASDQHATTAGGVKLYVRPLGDEVQLIQFQGIDPTGVTDSLPAFQRAIDWSIANQYPVLRVPPGDFLIDGTLQIRAVSGLISLHIAGPTGAFIGRAQLNHAPGQLTDPLLAIQASRSVLITDLRFMGNNTAPSGTGVGTANWRNPDPAAYLSPGVSNGRYNAYAGIAIDALNGSAPASPSDRYTYGPYGQSTSSDIQFERCRVQNFVIDLFVAASTGCENHKFRWCHFIESHTAYAGTQTQERNVVFENSTFNGHFVEFDTVTRGMQNGAPPKIVHGIHSKAYRIFQIKGDVGILDMEGGYLESVATLGIVGDNSSSAALPAKFSGVELSLIGHAGSLSEAPKDVPFLLNMPASFRDCPIVAQWNQHVISINSPVTFDNSSIRADAAGITSAQQDRVALSIAAGTEGRLNTAQTSQRNYSGTKYFNMEQGVSGLPARALVNNTVARLRDATNSKLYKVEPLRTSSGGPVLATRDVTGVTNFTYVNAETVTFNYTVSDDRPIMVGDRLLSRCKTPALPGVTPGTHIAPALEVTALVAGLATCKIIAVVDTTYFPTSVEVIVERFIMGTLPTGTLAVGSPIISGVMGAANLRVRDWIQVSDAAMPKYIRIAAISGTNVTMHRNASANGPVTIYNAKLTEIAA